MPTAERKRNSGELCFFVFARFRKRTRRCELIKIPSQGETIKSSVWMLKQVFLRALNAGVGARAKLQCGADEAILSKPSMQELMPGYFVNGALRGALPAAGILVAGDVCHVCPG